MVQPKFNKKAAEPATPGVSSEKPVSRKRKNGKNATSFFEYNCMHLFLMVLWFWRLVVTVLRLGPSITASRVLLKIFGLDTNPALPGYLCRLVVALQLDALAHVFIFWDLYARASRIKFRRTDLLFKYVQFCIPQFVFGVLVLLEPIGFDLMLQIQITMILNTCASLVVVIQSYTRLLTRKQKLGKQRKEKQRPTQKESSDEIQILIVTSAP